jgi:hypothetical protein
MQKTMFRVLLGLALCATLAGCLIYSSFSFAWEAQNLDGSASLTWRSRIVLLLLAGLTQSLSFWVFRRHLAIKVFVRLALFAAVSIWILNSRFAFRWEPWSPDGTFLLTWRSDVLILLILSLTQGLSFLSIRLISLRRRRFYFEIGADEQGEIR